MKRSKLIVLVWIVGIALLAPVDKTFATDILPEHPEPTTIMVLPIRRDQFYNPIQENGRYLPEGSPVAVPINDYVANVLSNEILPGSPLEARRAQAVAIRNYIWHRTVYRASGINHPCFNADLYPDTVDTCDTTDSTLDQAYVQNSATPEDYARVGQFI